MAEEKTGIEHDYPDTDSDNTNTEKDDRSRQFNFNCALSAGCCLLSVLFMMFCIISIIGMG